MSPALVGGRASLSWVGEEGSACAFWGLSVPNDLEGVRAHLRRGEVVMRALSAP